MFLANPCGRRERIGSAAGALAVQAGLIALFAWGLGAEMRRGPESPLLRAFDVVTPPPAPVETAAPARVESETRARRLAPGAEGGSSPPNLASEATPIAAPEPRIPLPPVSPMAAAPRPAEGAAATSGAAAVRGPGTGSGGAGDGSGSGAGGGGGGGGYGRDTPPRRIRGSLGNADYPAALGAAGVGGRVEVIFRVHEDGRVGDCRIVESSGSRALDARTCALIERRYVYAPARDEAGRPVSSRVIESHSWVVEDLPREAAPRRRRFE